MATDERDLREELEALARKREQIYAERRKHATKRGENDDKDPANGESLYSRMKDRSSESPLHRRGNNGGFSTGERLTKRQMERENDRMQGVSKFDVESDNKRPRMQSAVTKPAPVETAASDRRAVRNDRARPAQAKAAISEREKQRAVAPYAQKDGLARSRRMFGALMGHLGKAKAMIEKDSTLIKRQTSKQLEAEQKEKEQNKALQLRTKQAAAIERLGNMIAAAEVEMKEALTRKKLQHVLEARKGSSQSHFLLTVSSPPIYYLPKKHTKETEDLLAASIEAYQEKIRSSARDHEGKLREIEAEYRTKIENMKIQLEEEKQLYASDEDGLKKERLDSDTIGDKDLSSVDVADENEADENMGDDTVRAVDRTVTSTSPRQLTNSAVQSSPVRPVKQESNAPLSPISTPARGVKNKRAASPSPEAQTKRIKSEPTQSPPSRSTIPLKPELEEISVGEMRETGANAESIITPASALSPERPSQDGEPRASSSEIPSANEDTAFLTPRKQMIEVGKLKVTDLREELKKRGLDTKGLKQALVKRLEEALATAKDE